jgi:tRNA dimethylallyltransferase
VPHHLLDILDPAESYSAARFAADATRVIGDIRSRGRVPLLVGGTFLYFRALFEGLSELPPADPVIRAELEAARLRLGASGQHAELARVDPVTAGRLHPNDAQRVLRALEIHRLSGTAPSALYATARADGGISGPVCRLALLPGDTTSLDRAIAARLDAMFATGFVDEVARLRARGDLHLGLPSMRAVGYRQIWRHLDGEYRLSEARALAVIATRQYAKRQRTWLRGDARWHDAVVTEPVGLARVLNGAERTLL